MTRQEDDIGWILGQLPLVAGLVAATLLGSWICWFFFVGLLGNLPFVDHLVQWHALGSLTAGIVRWTGLFLTAGVLVRRATRR
ncbi:hypothetical protein [Haloarchaeobius sp. DFWS5]|uniref:hypothetical protein n=1 Tax=Haloarchaeobius sp. DFWS5 TaxID=3446114 RepID=UPI003EC0D4BA